MKYSFFKMAFIAILIIPFTSCKKEGVETASPLYVLSVAEIAEINENFCTTTDEHDYNDHSILENNDSADDCGYSIQNSKCHQ